MRPMTLLAVAALLTTGACAPRLTPEQIAEQECAAQGGKMQPVGRAQTMQCVVSYGDAGKVCRDGDDCLGDCRVPDGVIVPDGRPVEGRCVASSDRFGCYTRVEDGRAQPAICID